MSIVWPCERLKRLPFTDLAVDVVVVNPVICARAGGFSLQWLLAEMVRVLMPTGSLMFTAPAEELWASSAGLWAQRLLTSTGFSNVFTRQASMASDLKACQECGLPGLADWRSTSEFARIGGSGPHRPDADFNVSHCQPFIHHGFAALNAASRQATLRKESDLSLTRLNFPVENVLHSNPQKESWADDFNRDLHKWFVENYVSSNVRKPEWMTAWNAEIRQGRIRSVLDAGAGSCTLQALLLKQGLLNLLRPYVGFGAYDCSMLRICAERGLINFQFNWLDTLPFCSDCKFDLVFQAEGVHWMKKEKDQLLTFRNFDSVLACRGRLHMEDNIYPDAVDWMLTAEAWARQMDYTVERMKVWENKGRKRGWGRITIVKTACP